MRTTLTNCQVFDGTRIHPAATLVIDDGLITKLITNGSYDAARDKNAETIDLGGGLLAPGFVDIQINGGGGVLFNAEPSVEGIRKIAAAHRRFGTTSLLPTLISDSWGVMRDAATAVEQALEAGVPGVRGIHFEGPYISPKRPGCHPADSVRAPDGEALELFTNGRLGLVVVTLAPEIAPFSFIRALSAKGVRVCAGHTEADSECVRNALEAGLCGFTHLFNAMGGLTSREPGVLGTALDDQDSWCSLIADGIHVAPANIRLAVRAKPAGKVILVSDAMPSVGSTDKSFQFLGETVTAEGGLCRRADGVIAGSDLDMATAVRNMVRLADVSLEEALRMASTYPAQFLGLADRIGRIAPGHDADLVLLDENLRVQATWIGGQG